MPWRWDGSIVSDGKIDVSSSGPELAHLVTLYRMSLFCQSRGYLLLQGTEYPKTTGADFVLEELLGRGVFGDVFLVLHKPTRRRMAIKEFRKPLRPTCVAKTIENIQTLAHFRSPYVTQILGIIWNEHCFFLCQEYVERRSLNSLLQRRTPWEEVIGAVAYQILRGMAFLDENGLKHREIKPSNVLFGGDGRVLLTDFGLCQHLTDCISNTQIDSIDHMAPERVLATDATHANERSDVWTLGSLVYLTVKGHAVYPRERYGGMYQLVVACSTGTPPELSLLDFSPACRDFVQQCLRRDPEERGTFQTLLEHPFVAPYRADASLGPKIIAHFIRR